MISLEITRSYDDNSGWDSYFAAMKKFVLTFGLLSGTVSSTLMFGTLVLLKRGILNFDNSEIFGYTTIFLSCLFIFFGIRAYREHAGGGTVTFGRAFAVGILITLVSGIVYVATWEFIYFNYIPDFADKWAAHEIEKVRASGANEAEIAAKKLEMANFKKLYDNRLINAAMTFMEPFPVGLVVTLVSAAILRRKKPMVPAMA